MPATNPGTTSLVSWHTLDETSGTRVDSHGSNDLGDNNTVGYTSGLVSNSANFVTANSEHLSIANGSIVGLNGSDRDFTVSFWAYFTTTSATMGLNTLWDSTNGGWMFLVLSGGKVRFYLYPNSGGTVIETTASLSTGTWYHIVGYHDSVNNTGGLIINDGTPKTASHTTGVGASSATYSLGRYGTGAYLNGNIDEACFYDRVLTADEITWLYNAGSGRTYSELTAGTGTGIQLNISDSWKTVDAVKINIGDVWKTVEGIQINIGDTWKTVL